MPVDLMMPLRPGTTLGPYSVTAKIGEGGMGEVWQARDTKLDRAVALKVLPEAFTSDPDRLPTPKAELAGDEHDFASTQVNLSAGASAVVRDLARTIPDAVLGEEGRETKPHITVKYGLHSDEAIETVRKILADEPPIRATLGQTSVFPSSETGGDEVVKVDVVSEDLRRINAKIAEAVEVTDTHPEYQPHVTLAYVKPGQAQQYAGQTKLEGRKLQFKRLVFSTKAGEHIAIPLTGQRAKVALPSSP
ncbi:MAG: 2'-5' RNA ligase family protein [Vicinamibacterales bacterium]